MCIRDRDISGHIDGYASDLTRVFYLGTVPREEREMADVYKRQGVEPVDNYDYIHQSDLCGWVGQIGYGQEEAWFANAYRADILEFFVFSL